MKTKSKYTKPKLNALPLGFQPIQEQCSNLAGERRLLQGLISKYDAAVAALRSDHMPFIALRAGCVQGENLKLAALIDANRPLFQSPKTRTFSDIKVGLRKQPGRISVKDEAKTIALIEKHCPEQLDTLAPTTRQISKEALEHLPADLLKKLSVEVGADDEKVIVQPQENDVEKAVAALLAETQQPQLAKAA